MVKISRSGGIYIEVSANTKKLQEQLDALKVKAKATGEEISKNLSGSVDSSRAAQAVEGLSKSMLRAQRAAKAMNADFASQEAKLRDYGKEIGIAKDKLDDFVSMQLKGLKANFTRDFSKELRGIQRQTGMSTAEMNKLSKSLGGVGDEFQKATQSGGAFSSLLGGIRLGPASLAAAGAFAGYKALNFGKEAFSLASEYETLGVVVQQVGKVAGYSTVEIDKNVNAIRRMGIAGIEARKTLTQLVQAQVDITKTPQLARVAQDAAVIGGINSSEAFERMVHGISAAQTQVLRGIGINVNFEQAYAKYAASVGKATSELTENEKMQARVNAVLESGTSIAGAYEASMETLGKQMSSLSRVQQDFATDAGKLIVDMVNSSGVVDFYANSVERLNKAVLVERGRRAGLSDLQMGVLGGDVQALRELVELYEAVQSKALAFNVHMKSLEMKGVDTSDLKRQYDERIKPLIDAQGKIVAIERQMKAFDDPSLFGSNYLGNSKMKAELEQLQGVVGNVKNAMGSLIGTFEELLNIQPIIPANSPAEKLRAKKKELEDMAAEVEKEFAKTKGGRIEAAREKVKHTTTLHFKINSDKSLAVLKTAQDELDSLLNKGKEVRIGGSGKSSVTNDFKQLFAEIDRLEFDKLSPFEQIEIQAQKYLSENYPLQAVEQWKGLKLEALDQKQFDEANKAVQDFNRQYSQTFQNSHDVTESIIAQMDEFKKAAVETYGTGTAELDAFLQKQAELQARLMEEASRDALDGARRALRNYSEEAANAAKNMENAIQGSLSTLEDGLVNFATTGKLEISSMVDSIIADFARLAIRQNITGPLASGLSSLFGGGSSEVWTDMGSDWASNYSWDYISPFESAKGNVFPSGTGLSAYTNSIVASPTLFPFAKGGIPNIGLMGEAGAEAIIPLTRTSTGDLGVRAEGMGGGTSVEVNIIDQRSNQSEPVQVTESHTPDGMRQIQVLIRDAVVRDIGNRGSVYKTIGTMFDVSPNRRGY